MQLAQPDRSAQPVDAEQAPRLAFPVVGIGASAGGLEAVSTFLASMPPDGGMAFVLVQHLPPERESLLTDILSKRTAMTVRQVADGMAVEVNHLYVIRPGHVLTIHDGRLHLGPVLGGRRAANRPVDDFFNSLAEEQRERAIGIIMSGMGSDGSAGAQTIKAVGGATIAQNPESAQFPSMPLQLIQSGNADYILPPQDMPRMLLEYAAHPYVRGDRERDAASMLLRDYGVLRDVLTVLRSRTHQDFNGYRKPTLFRRVQRRMGLARLNEMKEYLEFLRQTPSEVTALADDLLIHVIGFFRNPQAWEALRTLVIAPLVASREADTSIRCWVTACSTGDEAYTLAMVLVEEAERVGKRFDIKVFATDMAERTLAQARNGIFPGGIEVDVSPERLEKFFQQEDALYRVRKDLRERVVFAPHNVLQDPPFSRLDIISCRNLLIYLEPQVQRRVLSLLHFGLREGGAIFLGDGETVAGAEDMFEPVDAEVRIFRRVGPTRHGSVDFPLLQPSLALNMPNPTTAAIARATRPQLSYAQITEQTLRDEHFPAAVLVDRELRIVYFQGDTRPFLEQRTGEPTRDLMVLALRSVRSALRSALHRAQSHGIAATAFSEWTESDQGQRRLLAVTASPAVGKGGEGYSVVSFGLRLTDERAGSAPASQGDQSPGNGTESSLELRRIRDELQRNVEELQTRNEEMKAAAEEASSINEELQSSNEELETSREEMQSLNEELNTVNAQLQEKMAEHQATSNDLASLLASTDIAVLFLDPHLRIRRFTPAVRQLFDVVSTDVGRPLSDFAPKFADPTLAEAARNVLQTLVRAEKEVAAADGRFFLRRIGPYRTMDDRIDGVVIAFIDVTARVEASARLAETARLLDLTSDGIIMRDVDNRITYWNRGATQLYGWTAAEAVGQNMHELLRTEHELPLDQLLAALEHRDRMTGEIVQVTRDGRRLNLLCRWALDRGANNVGSILTSTTDITERHRVDRALSESEERFRMFVDGAREFAMLMLDADGRITAWNTGAERLLGYNEAEAVGQAGAIIFTAEDRAAGAPAQELEVARTAGRALDERWHVRKDGRRFWGSGIMHAMQNETDASQVRGFVKVLRDETLRKRAEEELRQAKAQAEEANRMKDEFLATLSHELRTPLGAILLWTKMLETNRTDPAQIESAITAIRRSAESQKEMIEDLLDTSRLTSGKVRLQLRDVDLVQLTREALETIAPTAHAKDITITSHLDPAIGVVSVDPDRLRQVIWNLLNNAVKFTPVGGEVRVGLSRRVSRVELRVADSGEGIDSEFLPHVFTPFSQADGSSTRRQGGLGLGLAISRQLVELHGGTIRAESAGRGKGATFMIDLPLPRLRRVIKPVVPAAPTPGPLLPPVDKASALAGLRILLIDDEAMTRRGLNAVLRAAGATVIAVGSAAAAIDSLAESPQDVVLSDIGLPDADGYTLLRQIRSREAAENAPRVPAIALTAFVREEDRRKAMAAGFQFFLTKPVDLEELMATLRSLLPTRSS